MKAGTVIISAVMVAAVVAAAILMCRHSGLLPGFDFGAGQYYYTDLPNWERFFSVDGLRDTCPRWVYYALFAAWGYAMYRLWKRIDR